MSATQLQPGTEVQLSKTLRASWWHCAVLCLLIFGPLLVHRTGHGILYPIREHFLLSSLLIVGIEGLLILWVMIPVVVGTFSSERLFGRHFLDLLRCTSDVWWGIGSCVATFLLYEISRAVFGPGHAETRPYLIPETVPELLIGVFVTALFTAFCEELLFRGYLFNQLRSVTRNVIIANVLQASLFALAHGTHQTFAGVIDKFASGVIFCWIANRRKSLFPAMVAHALGNAFVCVALYSINR